jgi:hypothetical protein
MNHKHIYYILALTFFLLSSTHQPPALRKPTSRMLQLSCPAGPTSAALPSHPPPMTSAAPPSNLPLGTHASVACARSCHPWAAPVLGAAAPGQRRWHALPSTPTCSLRSPLPSPPLPASPVVPCLVAPSQCCCAIPEPALAIPAAPSQPGAYCVRSSS